MSPPGWSSPQLGVPPGHPSSGPSGWALPPPAASEPSIWAPNCPPAQNTALCPLSPVGTLGRTSQPPHPLPGRRGGQCHRKAGQGELLTGETAGRVGDRGPCPAGSLESSGDCRGRLPDWVLLASSGPRVPARPGAEGEGAGAALPDPGGHQQEPQLHGQILRAAGDRQTDGQLTLPLAGRAT